MDFDLLDKLPEGLRQDLGRALISVRNGEDKLRALAGAVEALDQGELSWAQVNQSLHRMSEAGMTEGFFRYYFLHEPQKHPYPVNRVLSSTPFSLPQSATKILSSEQLQWGIRRFMYDAMLYWGNFRQAYRDLRTKSFEQLSEIFESKRINEDLMVRRGPVHMPDPIPRDDRYLISELANSSFAGAKSPEAANHVQVALDAFRLLRSEGAPVTRMSLKEKSRELAQGRAQLDMYELMYEESSEDTIQDEAAVIALYSGQWEAFQKARQTALENTRVYLSFCNDLDAYVATSMRSRLDFRTMAESCDQIFGSAELGAWNVRYFDPTLSAAIHHEDKGIIECLMVKMAKVLVYFSQQKESLGKVSEYAMALSLGRPVIVVCPNDDPGRELYRFYRDQHPLMRLVHFETGVVNGAMVTHKIEDVVTLLKRIFQNEMEYDLALKAGSTNYYLLKERLTESTVRVITDDGLLSETFWNNWQGIS